MTSLKMAVCAVVVGLVVCRVGIAEPSETLADLQKLATQAEQAYAATNYTEVIRLLEQVVTKTPQPALEYNLACAYALTGQSTNALTHLERAVNLGMSDAAHMENDSDLASLKDLPAFADIVRKARAQAELQAKALTDVPDPKPIFLPAKGLKPGQLAPVLVFLHGMGGSPSDLKAAFEPLTSAWQYHVLLPCGSVKLGLRPDGKPGYNWEPKKDADLILAALKEIEDVQPNSVYLGGFSSGGIMAYLLAVKAPASFAGTIVFSGTLPPPSELASDQIRQAAGKMPFYIVHGRQDPAMPLELAKESLARLTQQGVRAKLVEFDGGHSLPANYFDLLKEAIQWFPQTPSGEGK